jgi:FMN phosphatase YigB (HAD superfamily)
MLKYADFDVNIKAFVFELDDVLFPVKDYDLQVYYLFTNFLEYLEPHLMASEMVEFISKRYEVDGNLNMFDELKLVFNLDNKYKANLDLLFDNVKLPLKLLLFKEALELLQEIIANEKQVYILTSGSPNIQLNKIQQTEWHALDKFLKVYFIDEFLPKPNSEALDFLITSNNLNIAETVFVGLNSNEKLMAKNSGVLYMDMINS